MKHAVVMSLVLAACSGGRPRPGPTTGSATGSSSPAAGASPFAAGCKAYERRCPVENAEERGSCMREFAEGSEYHTKCKAAGKLEQYTRCLVDDCFNTVKCNDGVSQCVGCVHMAECN